MPQDAGQAIADQRPHKDQDVSDQYVLEDNMELPWNWAKMGEAAANRHLLSARFSANGYAPPASLYLLVAKERPGLGQPAFEYFSLNDTGLVFSRTNYWPASTVKLMAAVGALWTLSKYQLTGAATVRFTDEDGSYNGTVASLYDDALSVSSNVAYNRLVEIAGFDEINDQYMSPASGLPSFTLQCRYTSPVPGANLRTSPEIAYSEGNKQGTIAKRVGVGQHPDCGGCGNCLTLFELLDVMRRVTVHEELPSLHRFPLAQHDVVGLRAALKKSWTLIDEGAEEAFGNTTTVYSKTGSVPGYEKLDHGLIVDDKSGQRYLIAFSVPYDTTEAVRIELVKQALWAIKDLEPTAPPLQNDAGVEIRIRHSSTTTEPANTRLVNLEVEAKGADRLEIWLDNEILGQTHANATLPFFNLSFLSSDVGKRLLVVRAFSGAKLIGYRAATVLMD